MSRPDARSQAGRRVELAQKARDASRLALALLTLTLRVWLASAGATKIAMG